MKLKFLCGFVLVAAILVAGWQRKAISQTGAANESLRQKNASGASVVVAQAPPNLNQQIEALQTANRDLPKLRNEVRQLREEKRELERLQAENERLAAALKAGPKTSASRMSEAEGFVLREKWARAGFATPEATVQTFFWAIANNDLRALAECMGGSDRDRIERALQEGGERAKQVEKDFAELGGMQGFRIAEKKQISEDKVELGLQAAAGGQVMPMPLRRFNGEWKFAD